MIDVTLKITFNIPKETSELFGETICQYAESLNRVVTFGWSRHIVKGIPLLNETYYNQREITQLPSQLACSVRAKAAQAFKSAKARKKKKSLKLRNGKISCVSLDTMLEGLE